MAAALRWPVSKLPTAVGAQMIHRSADDPAAVAFVTFFAILKVYEILLPVDTYYTVRVPKNCVLNAVAAGDDYLFDCLR
jgi:hypothetical protein